MSKWREVRCDFFNKEEEKYYVDAWKTGNCNGEGKVIAKVSVDGMVEYFDEAAKNDEYAQEVIREKLENMKPVKVWKIPVCWSMMGTVSIKAKTLEEAIKIAKDDAGVIPIPDNGNFLEDSWEVDCTDIDCLREYYNGNQLN